MNSCTEAKVAIPHLIENRMIFLKLLADSLRGGPHISRENISTLISAISDIEIFLDSINTKKMTALNIDDPHIFENIKEEYLFFQQHSTEAEVSLNNIGRLVIAWLVQNKCPIHILDFGCGDGQFIESLLKLQEVSEMTSKLSLVEVSSDYLLEAHNKLKIVTSLQIEAFNSLSKLKSNSIEIAIANHSLYYIQNVFEYLSEMKRVMKRGSSLFVTLANESSEISCLNKDLYSLHKLRFPKYVADDFSEALKKGSMKFETSQLTSDLYFEDSTSNRLKTIKFLTAVNCHLLANVSGMLKLFDSYKVASKIHINLKDTLFHVHF